MDHESMLYKLENSRIHRLQVIKYNILVCASIATKSELFKLIN